MRAFAVLLVTIAAGCAGPTGSPPEETLPRCSGCDLAEEQARLVLDCEAFNVFGDYTKSSVQAQMPPGLQPLWTNVPGMEGLPFVGVRVQMRLCDVQVSDAEVLPGVHLALVSVLAKPLNHTGIAPDDYFLFELMADSPRVVDVLSAYGIPASLAAMDYGASATGLEGRVTRDGEPQFETRLVGDRNTSDLAWEHALHYVRVGADGQLRTFAENGTGTYTRWIWAGSIEAFAGPVAAFQPSPWMAGQASFGRFSETWTFDPA